MQEDSFEFDKEYKDFKVDNPLLRQHKEWDNDAMTGNNGSIILLPKQYNRCSHLPAPSFIFHSPVESPCVYFLRQQYSVEKLYCASVLRLN